MRQKRLCSRVLTGGIDPATGLPITAEAMAAAAAPQMPIAAQPITQGVLGPGSPIPTPCLLLKNLFDPASETEDEWWIDIAEDVGDECGKHGKVLHYHVDRESQGFVYLKFEAAEGSQRARQALHSRSGRHSSALRSPLSTLYSPSLHSPSLHSPSLTRFVSFRFVRYST